MAKLFTLVPALLLAAFCSAAEAPSSQESVKPVETGKSFFWEGKAPSGARVWLLGSIHLGKAPFWPFDKGIEDAWASAKTLAVELDISDPATKAEIGSLVMASSMIPVGKPSLSQMLGEERAKSFDEALQRNCKAPLKKVDRFRPWSLYMLVSVAACQRRGWKEDFGIDRRFLELARAEGRKIVALETAQEQVGALAGVDDEKALPFLVECVESPDKGINDIDNLGDFWLKGDADGLAKSILEEGSEKFPEFFKVFLTDRNKTMAEGVKSLSKDSGAALFVVVGSAHLPGADGVVELLRKDGFELKQVEKRGK